MEQDCRPKGQGGQIKQSQVLPQKDRTDLVESDGLDFSEEEQKKYLDDIGPINVEPDAQDDQEKISLTDRSIVVDQEFPKGEEPKDFVLAKSAFPEIETI